MKSEDLLKKACLKLGVPYVPPTAGSGEKIDQQRVMLLRRRIAVERGKALCTAKIGERLKKKNIVRHIIRNKIGIPQVYSDLQRRASLLAAATPIQPSEYINFTAPMQPYQINRLNFLSSMNKGAIPPSGIDTKKSLLFNNTPSLEANLDIRKRAQPSHSPMVVNNRKTNITTSVGDSCASFSYLTDTASPDENQHTEHCQLGSVHSNRSRPLDVARAASGGDFLLRLPPQLCDRSDSLLSTATSSKSIAEAPPSKKRCMSGTAKSTAENGNMQASKQPPSPSYSGDEVHCD